MPKNAWLCFHSESSWLLKSQPTLRVCLGFFFNSTGTMLFFPSVLFFSSSSSYFLSFPNILFFCILSDFAILISKSHKISQKDFKNYEICQQEINIGVQPRYMGPPYESCQWWRPPATFDYLIDTFLTGRIVWLQNSPPHSTKYSTEFRWWFPHPSQFPIQIPCIIVNHIWTTALR